MISASGISKTKEKHSRMQLTKQNSKYLNIKK